MRRGTVENNGPSTVPEHHLDALEGGGSPSSSLLQKHLPGDNVMSHSPSPLLSSLSIGGSDGGGGGSYNNYGNESMGRPYNSVMNDPKFYFLTSHTAQTLQQASMLISIVAL